MLERISMRYEKTSCDLTFLLTCKKENLLPTFAKPKIGTYVCVKAKRDMAKIIIKTELKNKHRLRNRLRNDLRKKTLELKNSTNLLFFSALRYKIRGTVSWKKQKWITVHEKKTE